ncbi:MAG: signal peptidase I [Bdellovibrionaceae bacterium]|nr:signal peptidase I [Pseudobdellovibrionaceae bacterium]
MRVRTNKQGTWLDVFKEFVIVVVLMCGVRWILVEPFLVPSGSMIPTLLIKDYILVSKFSYGVRVPFTKTWMVGPFVPHRGEVVVFRSKDDDYYFLVKRVVGLPGDRIQVDREKARLIINGEPVPLKSIPNTSDTTDNYDWFMEQLGLVNHVVQYSKSPIYAEDGEFIVPAGHIFMMGDNRDLSSDSRVWGTLPIENILGKAQWIWMSCEEDSPAGGVLCFGEDLRANRLGKKIH